MRQPDTVSKAMTLGFLLGIVYMFLVLGAFMAFPSLHLEIIIAALLVNVVMQMMMFTIYIAGIKERRRHL